VHAHHTTVDGIDLNMALNPKAAWKIWPISTLLMAWPPRRGLAPMAVRVLAQTLYRLSTQSAVQWIA
jgi:hypothetical protein